MTRSIAVVTGTRAEFGLLRSVMRAIDDHDTLRLQVIVTGTHLLGPTPTVEEVRACFPVAATVPMQAAGVTGRDADARALGVGITGLAEAFASLAPDVVVVLGDRIEAFAAAAAAAVGGIRVAHLHGGDRAEGIADESLRHAITKLAHVHLPATPGSARRIETMGEDPTRVHIVGSPAVDDLGAIPPLDDDRYATLGRPRVAMLLHPLGREADDERRVADTILAACRTTGPTLALHPNHDPGREGIVAAIETSGVTAVEHLPRHEFVGLLRRVDGLVGNSSAGLIECAALGVRCVNVGPRQGGRERPGNVVDVPETTGPATIDRALAAPPPAADSRYGVGDCGRRVATLLAGIDLDSIGLRKRNAY